MGKPEIRFKGYTDEWEQRKLGDISEIKTGPFGSTLHADDYVSDGIPIITTEHFKTGTLPIKKDGLPQVSENDFNRLSAYILNEGDIVFSRVGSVDINALITPFQNNWLFSGRVLRVRPQGENSSQFLHTLLETESVRSDIRTRAVGQTMPSINTEILKITPLFLPTSIAEQERLGEYFHNLDHLITLHQRKPIPHPNHPTTHTKHKGEEKYVRIRVNDRGKINRTANLRRFPVDISGGFKN